MIETINTVDAALRHCCHLVIGNPSEVVFYPRIKVTVIAASVIAHRIEQIANLIHFAICTDWVAICYLPQPAMQ